MGTTDELRKRAARLEDGEIRGDTETLAAFDELMSILREALVLAREGELGREALAAQGEIQQKAVRDEREAWQRATGCASPDAVRAEMANIRRDLDGLAAAIRARGEG